MAHFPAMAGRSRFLRISEKAVTLAGHRRGLAGAALLTASWCVFGMVLELPQEWFLLTNMLGTLITLFLLLLMQHSQNRDMRALHTKADELIRSTDNAKNQRIGADQRETDKVEEMARDRQIDA
jgi:low affinity Fe/Cu permease